MRLGCCITREDQLGALEGWADYCELPVAQALMGSDEAFDRLEAGLAASSVPARASNVFIPSQRKVVGPDVDSSGLRDYVQCAVDRMERLGIRVLVVGSGAARAIPEGFDRERALEQFEAFLREVAVRAADHGVTVALEPLRPQETNLLNTVAESAGFIRERDVGPALLLADLYHMREQQEPLEVLAETAGLLAHVHVAGVGRGRPGPEAQDLEPFLRALREAGYGGDCSIECSWNDYAAEAPRALEHMRAVARRAGWHASARGGGPPLPEPPSGLGRLRDLRSIPSGLDEPSGELGKINSHTRAEPLLAATWGLCLIAPQLGQVECTWRRRAPMTQRTFGFGIIGCGVIAPFHARAIAELPNARLVAVADVVPEAAAKRGAEFGVDHYSDVDALLARPDVDIVSVCVPSGLHAEVGVRAAAARKHLVVEKPIEITLDAADRLIEACRHHGVALTVISQHRFGAAVQRLRGLIDGGRLGRLVLGDALIKWYRTQAYYDSGDWRGTWSRDGGGSLMNQGVHYTDLLQWTMGPVERVFARTATAAHERIEVEDLAVAVLRFASGALGVLQASTAVYPGLPERLEVTGTGGTVVIEAGRMSICELKEEKGETEAYGAKIRAEEHAADESGGANDPAAISHAGHRVQIADLLEAIETGRQPSITGEEARKPLELILAVYQSAREGREVSLPLVVSRS